MKELFEKYSIKLDIDTIINNPDPYTHHLDLYEVQNEVSRLTLQLEYLKLLEKQKTAEIYLRFKDSDMKITEKYIESQVNTSEEIRDLRNKIVELDTLVKYLLGIIRILENKTVINNSLLADRRKGILE